MAHRPFRRGYNKCMQTRWKGFSSVYKLNNNQDSSGAFLTDRRPLPVFA